MRVGMGVRCFVWTGEPESTSMFGMMTRPAPAHADVLSFRFGLDSRPSLCLLPAPPLLAPVRSD
jgi:hypothetical protein